MTDLDQIIEQCVKDVWGKFDTDNSGVLDINESRNFVNLLLGKAALAFSDEDFEVIFKEFDGDGNGVIDKSEMAEFLKRALGLNY